MVHQPEGDYTGPEGYTAGFTFLTGETRAVVDLRSERNEEVVLDCARRSVVQDLLAALGHGEEIEEGAYAA